MHGRSSSTISADTGAQPETPDAGTPGAEALDAEMPDAEALDAEVGSEATNLEAEQGSSGAKSRAEPPDAKTPEGESPVHSRNVARTLISLFWMYGGRGVGMLWTLTLISRLSIGDYGLYSLGFALMSIIGPALNNPFAVRSVRESEERFLAERTSRYLLGVALLLVGQVFLPFSYIPWMALTIAGGELVMKSYLAEATRAGHPDRTWRMDTIRQTISVVLGCIYLYTADHPTLLIASILYCAPYLVMVIVAGVTVWGHRPMFPGPPKIAAALAGEMLGTALYLQGDVLLLGWLTNKDIVGYYSITLVVATALATVGQSYSGTFVTALREKNGDLSAGPPLRNTLILGTITGALVCITGIALLISPAPTQVAVAMLIMSGYCAIRTVILVFQTVLYAQRRDIMRLTAAMGLVPVKMGLVAMLAGLGAPGAAIATTLTDGILLAIYSIALYRKAPRRKDVE